MFLELDPLKKISPHIRHGFFGRVGGKSTGVYESLNCGLATDDPYAQDNRAVVAGAMGGTADRLQTVYQVHGATCVYVPEIMARCDADAMMTDRPGVILGVLSADCAPVLFCAKTRDGTPIVAAVHAGWKGALSGILESTVTMMCDHGAELPGIQAGVGPCIAQRSYEVSMGFEKPFIDRDKADEIFFKAAASADKLLFDLPGYIARRLANCGVRHVALSDVDTVTNPDQYFSYRRATIHKEPDNGRQISTITIARAE